MRKHFIHASEFTEECRDIKQIIRLQCTVEMGVRDTRHSVKEYFSKKNWVINRNSPKSLSNRGEKVSSLTCKP